MPLTTALCEALNEGISSGRFVDTKIILYSYRDSSGRACRPKALYANSHVLKTVPYFNDLLFGDFAESHWSKEFGEAIDEEEYAEDYGYSSDSDLEDDEDKNAICPRGPEVSSGGDKIATEAEDYKEQVEKGKVVKIPDIAFLTFRAFLMYLYTCEIVFAPFGSEEKRRSRSAGIVNPSDDTIPRPSPKSIYRLADKYDVPELKGLALYDIRRRLIEPEFEIVGETFSRFASRFDEIKSIYLEALIWELMEDSTTRANVDQKIDRFVEGGLEHASEIVVALLNIRLEDDDAVSVSAPSPHQDTSIFCRTTVEKALLKSIREGVFFDREYLARHFKARDLLKPVYFSSIIMDDNAQQLKKLVKYFKGRSPHVDDLVGDVTVESDCEGDSQGNDIELLSEEKTRAFLTTGSFSAWKSLFFYCCTDTIFFAPLKSQGLDFRLDYIRQNTIATVPSPCSPKSIYVLANLLGIQSLCSVALADMKSKVTVDNVVNEIFSRVTASQEEIMGMQWDLLVPNLGDPEKLALVKENVELISSGSSPHCAGTLKLGIRKAVKLEKEKRNPPGVLRCTNSRFCSWRGDPSSVNYCQVCANARRGTHYLECAGCGYVRARQEAECHGCGKKFI